MESRIKTLEKQLRQSQQAIPAGGNCLTPETTISEPQAHENDAVPIQQDRLGIHQDQPSLGMTSDSSLKSRGQPTGSIFPAANDQPGSAPEVSILEMVYGRAYLPETEIDTLPMLPGSSGARKLVDAAYFYTQARYCIVDWTQLGIWHQQRDELAYVSPQSSVKSQTGRSQFACPLQAQ